MDAKFHIERYEKLESTIEANKQELTRQREEYSGLQGQNLQLQQQMADINHELQAARDDSHRLQVAKSNAEAEKEISKQGEQRAQQENESLRGQNTRQVSLLESVQRIEAGLDAKGIEARSRLQEEVDRLQQEVNVKTKRLEEEQLLQRQQQQESTQQIKNIHTRNEAIQKELQEAKVAQAVDAAACTEAREKVQSLESQLTDTKAELARLRASQAINGTGVAATPGGAGSTGVTPDGGSGDLEMQFKMVKIELEGAQKAVKEQSDHVQSYKAIASASENNLKEKTAMFEKTEKDLTQKLEAITKECEKAKQEAMQFKEQLAGSVQEVETARTAASKAAEESKVSHTKKITRKKHSLVYIIFLFAFFIFHF